MTPKHRLYRVLRWSEKYTKTDMTYLASGGFWSAISQIFNSLIIFGFAILVANFLPKAVYGQYKYIIATISLLGSFSLTGVGTAVFQSVASGHEGSLSAGFRSSLRWSLVSILGAFALAVYYFAHGNVILSVGLLIGGMFSPLLTASNLANSFLTAKKDFKHSAIYFGMIETALATGALIVAVLLTHNPAILAAVYFIGNTLATVWIYRRIVRLYQPDSSKTDPGMTRYAKHLSIMGVLSGIAGNIDQILLFHFVGPAQLAIYNFAIAIPDQTKGPFKALNTMVQANFVTRSDKEIKATMRNKMFWIALSSLIAIGAYILIAPYFYGFFFPAYHQSIFYSQIYIFILLGLVATPAGSYLTAKKKVGAQYINQITTAIFRIAALTIGVLYWGLLGLVVARVIINYFGNALIYVGYALTSRETVYREDAITPSGE